VSLPCAQQEPLSRNNTITLHGLSIPNDIDLLFDIAARAWQTKKVAGIE
jgi:hypothetical protein